MDNIVLGRYLPIDSFMHRRDPRIKILVMMLLLVAVLIPAGFVGYGIIAAFLLVAVFLSKLSFSFLWKAMKPMLFMLLFLLVINIFVIRTGTLWFEWGFLKVYSDAIIQTLYITVRLMLMIVTTTILTSTTKPLDLTLGIEDLLSPFKIIKMPAHEIAMILSIALRFIPDLIEETNRIMKAQASRGVDLQEGTIKEKIMAVLSLIVPLFVASFQRAEDLANAMEARSYVPDAKRTRYKQLHMQFTDIILFLVVGGLLASVIYVGVIR
jgi:ABC-type cobalt transport system, permease component CbiQ and related transporters